GADHGPRGGGDQQFLGDLLMRGDGMEGLVGDPLRGSVPIRPRAAEQQLLPVGAAGLMHADCRESAI
ncbi:MAG: hypothetical protein U1A81_02685, partial [Hydrogenophaga sp.]|nr:hypothetical protein [Hydrogenophaga sp.]